MAQIKATKDDIRALLDEACKALGITRSQLATKLGISYSALHGYVTRSSIQDKTFNTLKDMIQNPSSYKSNQVPNLQSASLEELISAIESKGWTVDLKRLA
jgi:transcriptional regulator with XRE-family HTH domain